MNAFLHIFLRALTLQLTLLLIALPVFIHWGLPLSVASCVGTLFFSPFLTLFLLLSSLIFFTQLLAIPNTFICTALEYTATIWRFFLSLSSESWLIGFAKPPLIVLLIISFVTLFVLTHKKLQTLQTRVTALTLVCFFIFTGLKLYPYTRKPFTAPIECGKKNLFIIAHPSQTIVFDPSALATKASPDSWIAFTFTSELLKQTGVLCIDHFILRTVSNRALQTLKTITKISSIKNIYLPFRPDITTENNPHFCALKKAIEKKGGNITCIENYHTFMIDLSVQIQLNRAGGISSPRLQVNTVINGITHHYK